MKIAVYCGSVYGKDPAYERAAEQLGKWIASRGHELVFGGSDAGLMHTICESVLKNGGRVIGVSPDVPHIREQLHPGLSEVYLTSTMAERKSTMIRLSDAYVALPGGIGTIDEISDVLCLGRIGVEKKPCVLYDVNGYYGPFREMMDQMEQAGFVGHPDMQHMLISEDLNAIAEFIEHYA